MPAFKILGNLKTSPLAGDDFQLICIVLGFYRAVQIVCLVPLIINDVIRLYNGSDLNVEGTEAQNLVSSNLLSRLLTSPPLNDIEKSMARRTVRGVRSMMSSTSCTAASSSSVKPNSRSTVFLEIPFRVCSSFWQAFSWPSTSVGSCAFGTSQALAHLRIPALEMSSCED